HRVGGGQGRQGDQGGEQQQRFHSRLRGSIRWRQPSPAPAAASGAESPRAAAGLRPPTMFDWNDLKYFVAVARHGSTLAAARALQVDQSTVQRRLAALERGLGAPLVKRHPHGYRLTEF